MTREERKKAIEYIKTYRKLDEDLYNAAEKGSVAYIAAGKCLKYWDMAIQALSQEPQCTEHPCLGTLCRYYKEPCTDAVSRQAVLDCFKKWQPYMATRLWEFKEELAELPPVRPQETVTEFADRCRECGKMRKGHWIYDETIANWRCSKCDETPKTMGYVGTADFMAEHIKFCNQCGAKRESEVQTDAT